MGNGGLGRLGGGRNGPSGPSGQNARVRQAEKATGLTPREALAAARGGGVRFDLWADGTGFTPNLDLVDAALRNIMLDMIRDYYDEILAELRREAGFQ
jgi:hypothetical protein